MITEIILMLFAYIYYVFSVFFIATIIQDVNKKYTILRILGMVIEIIIISPFVTPIILGIKLGEWIENN